MIRIIISALILLAAALAFNDTIAEEAKIPATPGMYTVTVTSGSDKSSGTSKKVVDICINEDVLDPGHYLPKSAQCSLSNVKKEGNKAAFDIECKGGTGKDGGIQVPAMNGKGDCSTTESEFYCSYIMEGSVQGEEFKVRSRREGKRIGDCPE